MNRREPSSHLADGAACAACGGPVSIDRIRLLASRDDLAFAEVPCDRCGSVGLAIFLASADPEATPPIGPDDVLDMHVFLAGWSGDLRSLVGRPADTGGAPGPL